MSVSIAPNISTVSEIQFDTGMEHLSKELTLLPIIGVSDGVVYESEAAFGLVLEQVH
jgi:hypothetical protein